MYLEPIKQRLLNLKLVTRDDLRGCTDEEIVGLEIRAGMELPAAYREFLILMGSGAGKFLRGSDCFYPHVLELQEGAIELLSENDFLAALPDDAFVFFMHQGYQFSFFRVSEGENPPVYSYCEGQAEPFFLHTHRRSTGFLAAEIDIHQKYLATPSTSA